jgi:hypothetical protein
MSTLGEKLKHELRELVRALARERVTVMFFPR